MGTIWYLSGISIKKKSKNVLRFTPCNALGLGHSQNNIPYWSVRK
jgi:hypothetical protein